MGFKSLKIFGLRKMFERKLKMNKKFKKWLESRKMRWWKKKLNYFSTSSKTVMDPSHRWPKKFIIRRTFFLRISNEIRLPKKIETHESLSLWEQNSGWNMHDIICNINSETKNTFETYSKSGDGKSRPSCVASTCFPHMVLGAPPHV